ncbi:unnamed protein product [Natator depressus]
MVLLTNHSKEIRMHVVGKHFTQFIQSASDISLSKVTETDRCATPFMTACVSLLEHPDVQIPAYTAHPSGETSSKRWQSKTSFVLFTTRTLILREMSMVDPEQPLVANNKHHKNPQHTSSLLPKQHICLHNQNDSQTLLKDGPEMNCKDYGIPFNPGLRSVSRTHRYHSDISATQKKNKGLYFQLLLVS